MFSPSSHPKITATKGIKYVVEEASTCENRLIIFVYNHFPKIELNRANARTYIKLSFDKKCKETISS